MMKALSLIAVCLCFEIDAQLVTILDSKSGEPISLAHVFIEGTSNGVVSNFEGEVNLSSFSDTVQITISHIAFLKTQFRKPEIQVGQITLQPLEITLSEITISDVTAFQILQKAIDNQKGHIPNEATHTGYYREYVATNDEYTKYADGQLLYRTTYAKDKNKFIITPSVIQSRVFSPKMEEEIDLDLVSPIDIQSLVKYNVVSSLGKFLNVENQEDYIYEFGSSPNPDYYSIHIEPNEGIEKFLYSAKLLIHRETMFIYELTYEEHPDYVSFGKEVSLLGLQVKLLGLKGQLRFEQFNNVSYLKYGKISFSMSVKTKKIDQTNVFTSELLVHNFGNTIEDGKMKSYNKKSLYKSDGEYVDDFWESGNAILLSRDEQKLIDQVLEKR